MCPFCLSAAASWAIAATASTGGLAAFLAVRRHDRTSDHPADPTTEETSR
jgi:hypothetical protein